MVYLLYPERRMVDEALVIAWAKDSLYNDALKATATGDGDANEAIARDVIEATMRNHESMTLDEAMELLEDQGEVSFDRKPRTPFVQMDGLDCIF